MTDIQAKIDKLAMDLHRQLEAKEPIDPNRIQQLVDMRCDRDKALSQWQTKRSEEMKQHTRTLIGSMHFTQEQTKLNGSLIEKIHQEMDKFDVAAFRWVESDVCPWEDSQAFEIAAGILVIAGEI